MPVPLNTLLKTEAPSAAALPAASAAQAAQAAQPRGGATQRPQQRLRLAMYLAFLALALAVALQGAVTWHLEQMRAVDARLVDQAAGQRLVALQMGHQAALLQRDPAGRQQATQELGALLHESTADALNLESDLAHELGRSPDAAVRLGQALNQWQAARERMWYRGENLLRQLSSGDPVESADLVAGATALQTESAPTAAAASALAAELRHAAEDRAAVLRRGLLVGMAGLLALLGVLSLAVVEPTARAVQRHAAQLDEQAAEVRTLALVAEHTTAMVIITDTQDRVVWVNPAFTKKTGWPLADVANQRPSDFLHAQAAEPGALARLHDALVRGVGFRDVWLNRTREGSDLWLDVDLCPLLDEGGQVAGYISVSTDVTLRMAQQAKLQALWSVLPAGVVVFGADGSVQEANREAERLLGLSLAQMLRLEPVSPHWRMLRDDGSDYPVNEFAAKRTLDSGEPVRNETLGVRQTDSVVRWLLVNTEALRDSAGQIVGVVACLSDITERRRLQDQLHDNARTDSLTRLPNRAAVVERLQRAIAHGVRHPGYGFALLFMDFDRFKQVNDTMGHGAGDELLRQIAARLQTALRPGDQLGRLAAAEGAPGEVAARLGGDEFVVVLEGVNSREAVAAVADRVLQEVSEPYLIGSAPLHSSASIGVVLHLAQEGPDTAAPTAEEVLRNADTAMYEAKRAGRGRWVMFDNSMHERVVRALAMEGDLRRALVRDEIFVVYQPVVDLASRDMVGVEALARWRHPERGLVPPVDFIPVAEEAGLIDAVGNLVLRKACTDFVAWRRELGPRAPQQLAVNLSRAQLKRQGMVQELAALLDECGMQPQWLQLEVTESLAAQDEPVQATLRLLKGLGLKLALDDFGTGYSSLACLHQLPVDTVKVDRSFVQHAETVEYHRVLIEATVRVARTLGMTTVAEGIETEGQAALMQALDCSRGQGYLFSRPLEAHALRALLVPAFEATA
jgi:diguanylate cyclase (GGDEF)-like protein/PAS domain S-box-containing protein